MTRLFQFFLIPLVFTLSVTLGMGQANAKVGKKHARKQAPVVAKAPQDGVAEARLIEIYRLIGKSDRHVALDKAHNLVKDFPTFALAQLVYGDLLSARSRPVQQFGDVPAESSKAAARRIIKSRRHHAAGFAPRITTSTQGTTRAPAPRHDPFCVFATLKQ